MPPKTGVRCRSSIRATCMANTSGVVPTMIFGNGPVRKEMRYQEHLWARWSFAALERGFKRCPLYPAIAEMLT